MKFYNVFSGFLTGKTKEDYLKNIGDRKFNGLHSYWYLKDLPDEKIIEGFSITKGNIMIDSGAFTAMTKDIDIDADKYIDWINKWHKDITIFGQIDVIPSKNATREQTDDYCKRTWSNYLYMIDNVICPEKILYTFHYGEDFKWLRQALEYRDKNGKPIEYIALGGLVGRSSKERIFFLNRCFSLIRQSSNPNIKVHGFGVSSEKIWRRYHFESCDSSSPHMKAILESEKASIYKTEGLEKVFGVRNQDKLNTTENEMLESKKVDNRSEENIKLLIKNIEFWDNLANSI